MVSSHWQRLLSRYQKIYNLTLEYAKKNKLQSEGAFSTVMTLVKGARHAGLVPTEFASQFSSILDDTWDNWLDIADSYFVDLNDELLAAARTVLIQSIRQGFNGVIDYDDQIYLSRLFGGVFPRFQTVMVDEAQDLSPLNHIQVKRTAAGRLIVVGDPRQAIYAFRGADSSSMGSLRATARELD
jgi:superfamily I DNA/RNA helicase